MIKKEKKKVRQSEPSKTSFFRLDKKYHLREYDKTNKVLQLSQRENIPTGKNETLYLCEIFNKNTNNNLD